MPTPSPSPYAVRAVEPSDHDAWARLFAGYREFYALEPSDGVIERVWSWLLDPDHELEGLVALDDAGRVLGIAHHRVFARPSVAGTGIWLDDLFTAPAARGRGVGRALIERLAQLSRDGGHVGLRWITSPDNATAQRLYDDIAVRRWVAYDLPT